MKFACMHKTMKSILQIAMGCSVVSATASLAQVTGPVIDLSSAITVGSGCDANSASVSSLLDGNGNSVLIVSYDRLSAQLNPPLSAKRFNCSMRVKTYVPAGKRLRLVSAVAHGAADSSGAVKQLGAMQIWLHSDSVALVQKNISSTPDTQYFELRKDFANGEAEVSRGADVQPGILGIDGVIDIQAVSRGGSGHIEISSIELTYKVD